MTQAEIELAERLIAAIEKLTVAIGTAQFALEKPSPGWRRMLDEFKGAVQHIPTSIRARW